MLLVLEGENALELVSREVGEVPKHDVYGAKTIRDTFAEMAYDESGNVTHAEPAVIIAENESEVSAELALFSELSARTPNITTIQRL